MPATTNRWIRVTILWALCLTSVGLCACLRSSPPLPDNLKIPPQPALKKVYLSVRDVRLDKEVLSPSVKEMKLFAGIGGVMEYLREKIVGEAPASAVNLEEAFGEAFRRRFQNLGVKAVIKPSLYGTNILIEIEKFWLDLNNSTFQAEIAYRAKLKNQNEEIDLDRIIARSSKYNLLGQPSGQSLLSETFSAAINSLDLSFIHEKKYSGTADSEN